MSDNTTPDTLRSVIRKLCKYIISMRGTPNVRDKEVRAIIKKYYYE